MYIRTVVIYFELLYFILQQAKHLFLFLCTERALLLFIIYLGLLNFICNHYNVLIILIFVTLAKTISKIPKDGAEAPKKYGRV